MQRKKLWKILPLAGVLLLGISGCGLDELDMNPNARYVKIVVKPEDARVVVKSMTDSRIKTLTPPYEYRFILRPFSQTFVEVTHKDYHRKIVRLDGTREVLNINLEKLTEEEIIMKKYRSGAAGRAGPSLGNIPGLGNSGMTGGGSYSGGGF